MTARAIAGLSEIAGDFDAVLFDQYGVLHDGRRAFPGALEAVEGVRAKGRPAAIVSNSGKRAAPNSDRLTRLGFPASLFDAVVTSGEICRDRLHADLASGRLKPGAAVFVVTSAGGGDALDGLSLRPAQGPEDAALVLIAGRDPERFTLEQDIARLAPFAARGAPAYCANPDARMYAGDGVAAGPGALAEAYEAAGGTVRWFGKPHRPIFDAALSALGDPAPARTLMVGDSPSHDIAGAQGVGCATLLVTEGVQAGGDTGVVPDFTIPRLVW
jgi:HAD superfamily hydrolase (TIGR01459 family)